MLKNKKKFRGEGEGPKYGGDWKKRKKMEYKINYNIN